MLKFAWGAIVGATFVGGAVFAESGLAVRVPTNGVLFGYEVQKGGKLICSDPSVFNEFRGDVSYIVCAD